MSNRAPMVSTNAVQRSRNQARTRWCRLSVGDQTLLAPALLRTGEIYADLATGFGAGPRFDLLQKRRASDPGTTARRRLSRNQKQIDAAHAAQRRPGERATAVFTSWRTLRPLRCCPAGPQQWSTPSTCSSSPWPR